MEHAKYWIALEQAKGIGPAHLKEIYNTLHQIGISVVDLFDLAFDEIKQEFSFSDTVTSAIVNAQMSIDKIENDYIAMLDMGVEIVPFFSSEYPERLKTTLGNAYPPFLYLYGNKSLLSQKGIAVLGEKQVSDRGELISYMGARELARHNIAVVSGFASGVDNIAHRSALENNGFTVAFIPSGFMHFRQVDFISEVYNPDKMLVVSPFYPAMEANKYNAYNRNKIICAYSCAVYIVEASVDGGIFEAAKSAYNLGVPLYTTQYSEYPPSATGNEKILDDMHGIPIKGKIENDVLVPNMDRIISHAKFG